jgi:hypothetical protein
MQVAIPSQVVSLSVNGDIDAVSPSDAGVLVIPEGASAIHVHSQYSSHPIFWSLSNSMQGDRVS